MAKKHLQFLSSFSPLGSRMSQRTSEIHQNIFIKNSVHLCWHWVLGFLAEVTFLMKAENSTKYSNSRSCARIKKNKPMWFMIKNTQAMTATLRSCLENMRWRNLLSNCRAQHEIKPPQNNAGLKRLEKYAFQVMAFLEIRFNTCY